MILDHWGDHYIIRTNADDSIDFKIMRSDAAIPSKSTWKPFIEHRKGIYITGIGAYARYMVRNERINANSRIIITNKSDLSEHAIEVDEEAYALSLGGGLEYDTDICPL